MAASKRLIGWAVRFHSDGSLLETSSYENATAFEMFKRKKDAQRIIRDMFYGDAKAVKVFLEVVA